MTILTVCNHKGGTGKTTTAIHLAAAWGLSGRRTLVVDLDPQGFLTRMMDVAEPPPEATVAAFFDPSADLTQIQFHELAGFDLIASSSTLTRRMRQLNKPTDVLWVREAIDELALDYDVVVFDTAAAVTVYSLNALVTGQHVVIPVLPEYQPVVGAEQTFQTAGLVRKKLNPSLQSRRFLFTQVDGRKRSHETYREYVRDKYGPHVLNSIIRTSASLSEAHEQGRTVFDGNPNTRGARDYANAADELWHRLHADPEDRARADDAAGASPPGDGTASGTPSPDAAADDPVHESLSDGSFPGSLLSSR
jgi:chromosome partitioning protein